MLYARSRTILLACMMLAAGVASAQSIYVTPSTADGDDPVVLTAVRDLQALLIATAGGDWELVATKSAPRGASGVVIGPADSLPNVRGAYPFGLDVPEADGYLLHSVSDDLVVVTAPTSRGVRNGIYALLEHVGFGFYLSGVAWPEGRVRWSDMEPLNASHSPVFSVRGTLPWYNFFNSPTTWEPADHRAFVDALARMRMTFVGFHAYDSEPFAAYAREDGELTGGAPLLNTLHATWGTKPIGTDAFYGDTGGYFAREAFGAASSFIADQDASIRAAKAELADALAYAKARGLSTCLGFEVHGDPTHHAVQDAFERRLTQLLNDYPMLDYVWIWEPEAQGVYPVASPSARSPWESAQARWDAAFGDIEDARRRGEAARMTLYAEHAQRVVDAVRPEVRLVVSGWGGDAWLRFSDFFPGMDQLLPEGVTFSALDNIRVTPEVSEAYGKLAPERQRWPIIWFEFDGDQWMPQPNLEETAGACRDALAKGCQGLLGIHWRTRAVEESAGYVSRFAWDPDLTVAEYIEIYAAHRYGAADAATYAPVLKRLQRLGYRWAGGGGQNECAPFTWGLGEERKIAELRGIASQLRPAESTLPIPDVTRLLPTMPTIPVVSTIMQGAAGPAADDQIQKARQDLLDQIDFVQAYEDVSRRLMPGGQLDDLIEREDRRGAVRYIRESGLAEMLHLYARRIANKGELGVLATMNAKLWADVRDRLQPTEEELEALCAPPDTLADAPGLLLLPDRAIVTGVPEDRALTVELRLRRQGASRETVHALERMGRTTFGLDLAECAEEPGGYEYGVVVKSGIRELLRFPSAYPQRYLVHVAQGVAHSEHASPAAPGSPETPADLRARPLLDRHAMLLEWTPSPGETYAVYRDRELLGRTALGWFEDMAVRSEATHTYVVESRRVGGEETAEATVRVTTPGYPLPQPPGDVAATSRAGRITIAWDSDAASAVRYVVTKLGIDQEPVASYTAPAAHGRRVEFTDTDVTVGRSYTYTVAAVSPDGRTGPPSRKVGIMAAASPLTPVLELNFESDDFLQGLTQLAQNALALGGSGWAELPSQPDWDPKSELTLSLWVNLDDLDGMPVLLCKGAWQQAGYFLQIYQGAVRFYLAGVDTLDAGSPQPGEWQHIVATFGAGEMRIYLDGELAGAKPVEGLPIPSPTPLLLGRYGQNEDFYFVRGMLDDVAVYDVCLTPTEIRALRGRQAPAQP